MNHKLIIAALAVPLAWGQTQIHLQTQSRAVDFSGAPSTKPAQTGSLLPAACSPGAVFVLMTNAPGENLYVCTSSNNWSLQSTGGATPNVLTVAANGTALNIGPGCSGLAPCNVRVGQTIFSFQNGMTATISGGSGQAYVYVSSSGILTAGHSLSVTCSGGCVSQTGINAFPADSYPVAVWTATNGVWNATGTDARAVLGRDLVTVGTGLTSSSAGGSTAISAPGQEAGFQVAFRGSDVSAGITTYLIIPYACTITDWAIASDGTATIALWRVPDGGTGLPTDGDSLNASGFSLSTGHRIHSTDLSDLSSISVSAFDTIGVNLLATAGSATHVEFSLGCTR
jgi:hypothetical protein